MSRADAPQLRGTWLGSLLRWWNPVMRLLLGSPLPSPLTRWFMLFSWTGNRSGRVYTTPVAYVREGATVYVTTGDRWWRNLVGGAPVRVRLAGVWREARATAVTDLEHSREVHERLFREHPHFRRLAGISGAPEGSADAASLERSLRAGRTLVRIEAAEAGEERG